MTIEQVRQELSRQIRSIEMNGFGYLGPVLRVALFGGEVVDWGRVRDEFLRQNPATVLTGMIPPLA
jgi:hypothetical protein